MMHLWISSRKDATSRKGGISDAYLLFQFLVSCFSNDSPLSFSFFLIFYIPLHSFDILVLVL